MTDFSFAPLSYTLPAWPAHLFGGVDLLDRIGVLDFEVQGEPGTLSCSGTVAWLEEIELRAPGLDEVSIAFLSSGGITQIPFAFTLLPEFSLTFPDLSATLRIRSPLLRRVKLVSGKWVADLAVNGDPKPTEIELHGVAASVTADGEISVSTGQAALTLSPFEIGTTGLIIDATDIGLFLHASDPPPPGAQPGFKGVAIDTASIYLTGGLAGGVGPSTVLLTHVLIGSSGFSGHIQADWAAGTGNCTLFGMKCELISLDMDFAQNKPVGGGIKAKIELPFFDRATEVEIGYTADGGLAVGLTAAGGLASLVIANVLTLELDSLKFTVDNGVLTVRLSGMIIPKLTGLKCPPIRVDNLEIDSKGHVNLPGGWLALPKQYGLDFHGFKIEITKFGLGHDDNGDKWIGFTGGIKLVDGLPAGVSVDGLRITSNADWSATPRITLSGVGIELDIKDVLYFKGAVAYRMVNGGHRFDGAIRLELRSLKFNIDGQFVVGNTSTYRYMALYVALDLPVGLPVLCTDIAVYGIAGMFALNMAPDKLPDEKWYGIGPGEGWYKKSPIGVTSLTKWAGAPHSKALGLGVKFGTLSDNGYMVNASVMFVGVFPGPMLVQGAANIAKDRAKLNDDPLFRALAVYDRTAGDLLVGLDVSYKYDASSGKVIKLSAGTEAYYKFDDPTAWRINLGLKTPTEQRIQARIFNMLDANAYIMISPGRFAMGAWVGYARHWKFGPLKVGLEAWMETNVQVSTKPIQFSGNMALHGGVELAAFGFGLSLTVDASVEAEVFKPKHLLGKLDVALELPRPWPKKHRHLTAHLTIEFGPEELAPQIPVALKSVSIEHMKVSTTWPLLASSQLLKPAFDDGEGFLTGPSGDIDALPANIPVVPMDCRPSLHFARDVHDDAQVGALVQIPDPEWEWIGDPEQHRGSARVRYALVSVILDKLTGSTWTPVAGKGEGAASLPELFGSWTPVASASSGGVAQNRLTLWSSCGFDSFRNTGMEYGNWFADHFGGAQGYPCVHPPAASEICLDFLEISPGESGSQIVHAMPLAHPAYPGVTFESDFGPFHAMRVMRPGGGPNDTMHVLGIFGQGKDTEVGIDVRFASPAAHVRVKAMKLSPIGVGADPVVTAESPAGAPLAPISALPGPGDPRIHFISRVEPDGVAVVHVRGGYSDLITTEVGITQVCALMPPGPAQLASVASASAHNQNSSGHWTDVGEVLEPHTVYRLRIGTRIAVDDFPYDPDFNVAHDLVQAAFFQTQGPPGLATLSAPLEPSGASTDTGLEDLTLYVEQTVPPTVPPRGRAPVLPRPVFRAYAVGARFNAPYVDLMYRLAGRDLAVILYDRNNQPVRGQSGTVAVADNPWGVVEAASLTERETRWIAMIAANDCVPAINENDIPKNLTLTAPAELLAPDMLHEARLTPLLLHEDFARIESGTGRWQVHDFSAASGPSTWAIGQTTVPVVAHRLIQDSFIGLADPVVETLGTAAWLGPDPRIPAEDPALWTDYRVAASLRAEHGAAIGLAFRWAGPGDFYLFAMDERTGEGRKLYRVIGGTPMELASDGVLFSHSHDYPVVVEAIGGTIRIWVEDILVFDVVDAAPIPAGTIAFHCSAASGAAFSDVRVHDLSKGAISAYKFSFTTSQFVNFHHQVHSHDDDAWPGACTLSAPDLAAAHSLAVAAASAALPDDEARAFEAMADNVLGTRARQEAVRTETCRVASPGGDLIGLLVRSPEPFDHARVALSLGHYAGLAPASVAPAAVKLVAATVGAAQPADEIVTLLVRNATDLSGWALQMRDVPAPDFARLDDSAAPWTTIYVFDAEARMEDATLVRIYCDGPPAMPADSRRRKERYRGDSGGPDDLKLVGDCADLRLVSPGGRVEHARRFYADPLFAPLDFRLLRKADGTAFFLLPAGASAPAFPPGTLKFTAEYRRDNRTAVPDSLVLAEGSDTSSEIAVLDIPTEPPIGA